MNEKKLEEIGESMQKLNPSRLAAWGASRVPNEIDDEITDLIKGYLELDDGGKEDKSEKALNVTRNLCSWSSLSEWRHWRFG
jgi:hypothetical protein